MLNKRKYNVYVCRVKMYIYIREGRIRDKQEEGTILQYLPKVKVFSRNIEVCEIKSFRSKQIMQLLSY